MDKHREKLFGAITIVFYVIATLHVIRIISGWTVIVDGYEIPIWLSWAMAVSCTYLGWRIASLNE